MYLPNNMIIYGSFTDTMEWAWKSAEMSKKDKLSIANLDKEAREYQAQLQQHLKVVAVGSLIGTLGGAALQFGFGKVF